MQQITVGWLVFRLTHSVFFLGIIGFADKIPVFLFSPFAGVLVDRYNNHKILIWTQIFALIQALIFAFLILSGQIQMWHIVVLVLSLGLINSVDIPARQSFVVHMLEDRQDLGNAIALNSSIFNGARLIGPSIGGIMVALVGEGMCFLVNAGSFFFVILALLNMKIPARLVKARITHPINELKEGIMFAFGNPKIRHILMIVTLFNFLAFPYTILLPAFVGDILHGGPRTLGFLMASAGLGAFSGALYLASRKTTAGLIKWITAASLISSVSLILLSFTSKIETAFIFMAVCGLGMIVQMASGNTILQTLVDDDKRGRVMSLFTIAAVGIGPFGSLLLGTMAQEIGIPLTLRVGGLVCLVGALAFATRPDIIRFDSK